MTKPEASIEGRWQMVRAELAGEPAPELVVQNTELELRDGRYTVRFKGEVVDSGWYSHEWPTESGILVLNGEFGPNSGRTIPCKFQLKGSRMRVSYGIDGVLPKDAATILRTTHYVATYRHTP